MKDPYYRFNSGRVIFVLLSILTVIAVAAVLKITSSMVLPFTISLFLACVASPMVKFLVRLHIPRLISIFLIVILLLGVLFGLGMILSSSGRVLITLYPKYEERIREIYIWVARIFELPYDEHLTILDNIWGQASIRERVRIMTISFSNGILSFLIDAFMVAIFLVFLLLEAAFFREKLDKAFTGPKAKTIKRIGVDVMTQVTRYLSIMFMIAVLNGVLVGVGLKIIGVEFAVIWGVIQFVFNFIPNIGSIAVSVAATAFALIQFWPAPGPIIATGIVMLIFNLFCGFILTPKIMGDGLGLSAMVVLVALLIWGWIWGFAGLILAVPMMAIIKIFCENVPVLEPISVLLGSHRAVMAARASEADYAVPDDEVSTPADRENM